MKLLFIAVAVLVLVAGTEAARIRPNRHFDQLSDEIGDRVRDGNVNIWFPLINSINPPS